MLFTSDLIEQILGQLSEAILLVVKGDGPRRRFIPRALHDLTKLEVRPACLTVFAYDWCSGIYGNRENLEDWENLLLVCLELGFRHLDVLESGTPIPIKLTHTEHHRGLVDIVFRSRKSEAIADLLHAWTLGRRFSGPEEMLIDICTGRLVGLRDLVAFSPRLRQVVIRFVAIAGYEIFEGVAEELIESLDHNLTVEEVSRNLGWAQLLLGVIRSSEETERLPDWYWELLVELAVSGQWLGIGDIDVLKVAKSLIDAEEWGKLENWIGIVWMLSKSADVTVEDLELPTLLLFRQRPGAAQRLGQWMEQGSERCPWVRDPESFRRILTQAHEAVQRQDAP